MLEIFNLYLHLASKGADQPALLVFIRKTAVFPVNVARFFLSHVQMYAYTKCAIDPIPIRKCVKGVCWFHVLLI